MFDDILRMILDLDIIILLLRMMLFSRLMLVSVIILMLFNLVMLEFNRLIQQLIQKTDIEFFQENLVIMMLLMINIHVVNENIYQRMLQHVVHVRVDHTVQDEHGVRVQQVISE